ncbi:hypothetical protein [Effusibacillus consociatus]|uniref:Uncharacterized protein n=1 Tax=Effusibacillus consociatus TaxID=1117041 RepID=A0ABV9PUQ9_9BACL
MKLKNALTKTLVALSLFSSLAMISSTANAGTNRDGGSISGTWSGNFNDLDLAPSQKAELLFGYNNGNWYGNWSHVAMTREGSYYGGGAFRPYDPFERESGWDGYIVEATTWNPQPDSEWDNVYTTSWQSHFHKYDAASLDYVSIPNKSYTRDSIVYTANSYGGTYNFSATWSSNNEWFCSKLVARAFYDNTGYIMGWDTPSGTYYDNAVYEYRYATSAGYDGGGNYAWTGYRHN